ncbi:type VI secretion system baseplate subunit TssK [Massilia psychrophila]|uniref:Uncharacterized protein n=1 Tax=Massilia psychrophila TaxID=1603353 RepID=A0A2G8T532_9BURK|nr:type VI secretion system baseplate subunit TssK [Massilia psychrophila]PIL41167.1 hypothetical protein CR103_03455 [Massilia psychrophila]
MRLCRRGRLSDITPLAYRLRAAVPIRFKISSSTNIDDIVRLALPGVKLTHMVQVQVPVRLNTHYFSLENKGMLFEAMLKTQTLTLDDLKV